MHALVVPTVRDLRSFLTRWNPPDIHLWDVIVVEDRPEKTHDLKVRHHYCWKDIEEEFGEKAWTIFSKQDSAIRCYGLYKAWQLGYEYIFTLDDDCWPIGPPEAFVRQHIANFRPKKWTESVPGLRTRGLPYGDVSGHSDVRVAASVGLWEGNVDFDAVTEIAQGRELTVKLPSGTRVMPSIQYWPMCGMNVCFHRDFVCLYYSPKMGHNSPYRRFDDIWAGVVMQKCCQELGVFITCGEPFVFHDRRSNAFENLVKEAPGIGANEEMWKHIDSIYVSPKQVIPWVCLSEIGELLSRNEYDFESPIYDYLKQWGVGLSEWAKLYLAG